MKKELTQSNRRIIVAGFFACFVLSLIIRLFAPNINTIALTLNVIGFVFIGALLAWGKSRINPKEIDERQKEIRNQMYFRSYIIVCILLRSIPSIMTILFITSEATARNLLTSLTTAIQRPVDFIGIIAVLAPLLVFLPWALLAWLEPDPLAHAVLTPAG